MRPAGRCQHRQHLAAAAPPHAPPNPSPKPAQPLRRVHKLRRHNTHQQPQRPWRRTRSTAAGVHGAAQALVRPSVLACEQDVARCLTRCARCIAVHNKMRASS